MQPRRTQIGINNKDAAVALADDGLRQVGGDKCLSLSGYRAGHQDGAERLIAAQLIKPRAQGTKLLRTGSAQGRIAEDSRIRIGAPLRTGAAALKIVELKRPGGRGRRRNTYLR